MISKRTYKTTSSMERGTLFQLWNLLGRRNISTSVKANVNAWEDYLDVITKGQYSNSSHGIPRNVCFRCTT